MQRKSFMFLTMVIALIAATLLLAGPLIATANHTFNSPTRVFGGGTTLILTANDDDVSAMGLETKFGLSAIGQNGHVEGQFYCEITKGAFMVIGGDVTGVVNVDGSWVLEGTDPVFGAFKVTGGFGSDTFTFNWTVPFGGITKVTEKITSGGIRVVP